ncbi:helix-turn-helix domain-containing protein [Paenibacillus antri]|uniref:Helix-turn-helix domain-containing protein n=1 Tax=Paenibacillus antri TaxID=2582848 RepID=A0A5R9GE41_9BACL|nr:helix-turn-helix domain-containing protein [Paenibacillus antri]TLS52606.1 helix-turn-helix domain-containing protein [Paenibacillus antri]
MITLLAKDIFDVETEVHFAHHRSLATVTGIHDHDFYEVFLVSRGAFHHIANGERTLLEEGAFAFVRPNDAHYYEPADGRPGELLNIAFPSRVMDAIRTYLGDGFDFQGLTQPASPPVVMLGRQQTESLLARFRDLTLLPPSGKRRIRAEARAFLADALMRYFAGSAEPADDPMPDWLERLVQSMKRKEQFVGGIVRMHELSPKSPEHLSRTFKKYLGVTPTQWINEARLQYAGNLLIFTDEPVLSVCYESGFENVSHFNHQFKRCFGLSPTSYRKARKTSLIPEKDSRVNTAQIRVNHSQDSDVDSVL